MLLHDSQVDGHLLPSTVLCWPYALKISINPEPPSRFDEHSKCSTFIKVSNNRTFVSAIPPLWNCNNHKNGKIVTRITANERTPLSRAKVTVVNKTELNHSMWRGITMDKEHVWNEKTEFGRRKEDVHWTTISVGSQPVIAAERKGRR